MDETALALKMKRLARWLDSACQPDGFMQRQFDGAPFGHCYVTMDRDRQGPAASFNRNRVHICGKEPGLEPDGLNRLVELFAAAGVNRFFVWLSPGPDMDVVRRWLGERRFSRVRWTGYPTLCREGHAPFHFRTDFAVRQVGADEIAAARAALGDTISPEYARSAGRDGFFHYMAFDGMRPVAVAALCVFEDIGYLTCAATAERHRKQGAQQALIAHRIQKAEEIGCSALVSETLTMLEQSHRNLQRAGFRDLYDKEVYEWNGQVV
jgi:GNAT superfamily N-acetyltransferase